MPKASENGIRDGGLVAKLRRARVALRIARRSTARAPGRSALIVALVALPVAGMAAVTLIIPSTVPTQVESLSVELGQSEARVHIVGTPLIQDPFSMAWGNTNDVGNDPSPAEPVAVSSLFPAGTEIIPLLNTAVTAETRTGVAALSAVEGEVWDPALTGRYEMTAGHAPTGTDEVMVTAATLDRLGIGLGDQVQLVSPVPRAVSVVGLIDSRTQPASSEVFFGRPGTFSGDPNIAQNPQTHFYLPDTVLDWSDVQELNAQGAVALSRYVLENPPPLGSDSMRSGGGNGGMVAFMLAGMIVGFALLEVTLLAGAAFMVGARAQERSLATVASVGSTRSTLFSIITANGVVLGAIGGILGVAIGIGAGSLFMQLTDDGSATRYWGYHLWWPIMLGIAAFAIVIGWLGALVPAVRASRMDVVAALRGARRPAVPSRRRPVIGVVIFLSGVGIALIGGALFVVITQQNLYNARNPQFWAVVGLLIVGPVLAQLGLILCSGLLLRLLSRALSRAGVAARLASRDAARNPGRSVPALAVIMTTVFAAVFAMTMITSSEVTARANYNYSTMPDQVQLPLQYWEAGEPEMFEQPKQFEAALSTSLDVDVVRTLKSVPDPFRSGRPDQHEVEPDALVTTLIVPPENQCPSRMDSVNFDEETRVPGSDAAQAAAEDWRCQNSYVLSGSSRDGRGHIWVGDAADLALVLGEEPSRAASDALASGGAVALYPEYVYDGQITISWWSNENWQDPEFLRNPEPPMRSESIAAVIQEPAHPLRFGVFVSAETADQLGLEYADATVLASTNTPPTDAQLDALNADVGALIGIPGTRPAQVENGPQNMAGAFSWGILGLSALIAIGAAAVAIGLARFDGRRDQATLNSVGSSPGVRRGFGFWQALVVAGTGAILGAAVGLVPPIALTLPGSGTTFSAPWLPIAATAILMPLGIACGSWLLAGRRKPELRRSAIE